MTTLPSPPADAPEGYTLEQAVIDAGLDVPPRVRCPHCRLTTRPFAIVVIDDIPDDHLPGQWGCSTCRQDYFRGLPDLTPQYTMADLRAERDLRLTRCDWTQLPDVPEVLREGWRPYRQALRDLPGVTTDIIDVRWPEPPEAA